MHEITSWSEELRAAYLYRVVAAAETGTPRQKLFLELAAEAEGQAAIWADKVRVAGGVLPVFAPDVRARVVAGLVRSHGPRKLRTVLAAMKVRGMSVYTANSNGQVIAHHLDDTGHHHAQRPRPAVPDRPDHRGARPHHRCGAPGAGPDRLRRRPEKPVQLRTGR